MATPRFAPDLGGVARSSARIAGALANGDATVSVVSWSRALPPGAVVALDSDDEPSIPPGVRVHRVGLFGSDELSMQHTLDVLHHLHDERPADVVWGHYGYPAGYLATLFAGLVGRPAVVALRGNDIDSLLFPPGDFARLRWACERAARVVCVSRDLAAKVAVVTGHRERVVVVPNSVDAALFRPGPRDDALARALGVAEGEAVLGFSGELRHKKGAPFLLRALHEVRRHRPACLLVIGELRPKQRQHLDQFRDEHPADAERVIVTGHLEDPRAVAGHLRLCDLVLLPSLWDGLPNALLEAMACGVPTLVSDAGGIPDVVRHDEHAFVVPRAQLHRLGEAAREVLALPEAHRRRVAAAARDRVLEDFGLERERAVLRDLVAEVAAQAQPGASTSW